MDGRTMTKTRTTILLLILAVLISSSCGLRSRTTTIRGYVHSGDQKVTGGEVRLSTTYGGREATTQIGSDGRFRLTLEHPSSARLEIKVLQPGFVHDPIEFNSADAPQNEIDINLKRLFTPASNSNK